MRHSLVGQAWAWISDWRGSEFRATCTVGGVSVVAAAILALLVARVTEPATVDIVAMIVVALLPSWAASATAGFRLGRDAECCGLERRAHNTKRLALVASALLAAGLGLGVAVGIGRRSPPWWGYVVIGGPLVWPVLTLLLVPLMSIPPHIGGILGRRRRMRT